MQLLQIELHGFSDDFQIDRKITVCHTIAHGVKCRPRHFVMPRHKIRGNAFDIPGRFADDFDIAADTGIFPPHVERPTLSIRRNPSMVPSYAG